MEDDRPSDVSEPTADPYDSIEDLFDPVEDELLEDDRDGAVLADDAADDPVEDEGEDDRDLLDADQVDEGDDAEVTGDDAGVAEDAILDVEPTTGPVLAAVPAVVAVLVTHDPGPWFEETLESLADQSYPDLSVLVVDAASAEDPTDRVQAVLPDAIVHRLEENHGYGAATNVVLDAVEGASFYLLCHDDVALEADTVRSLVEEAFRSNAGIVGPKLVDWHEPRRLLQAGMGIDKTGVLAPIVEPGELDQEQHDAVRDVFVVPTGVMLVRADLFEALGGFDDGIDHLGDDLDLCWRAHLLGARVIIAPVARVRHLEALGLRHPRDDRRRAFARHRLRTTMTVYQRFHRWRVLPQAALLSIIEAIFAVVSGRPGHASDVLGAWTWNLRRRGQIRRRRKELNESRRVKDSEIRAMQVRGSARVNAFFRGQFLRSEDRVGSVSRSTRDILGNLRDGSRQFTGVFAMILVIILAISSRGLVLDGVPAIGEFSRFPGGAGGYFARFWSGWRPSGLGSAGPQPTAFGLLGVASVLSGGFTDALRTFLIIAPIPIGALGAWRLARPIGSARASVTAFAVYLAIPVPYNALARGSWSGLLCYAAAPWILLIMGRASGIAPFGPTLAEADDRSAETPKRRTAPLVLSLGLLLGVVMAFVPFMIVIATVMAIAIVIGSVFCFRVAGSVRLLVVTMLGVVTALVLNAPWSIDLFKGGNWSALVGLGASSSRLDLGQLLRFESGPWGAPPLGFAFLLAAALPIVIGRSWRLEWAVRAWFVALVGWAVLWASSEGHIGVGLPTAEVILAPVAASLALAAALGLSAFETDLRRYRFGWRQLLAVAAALGVVLGAIPLGSGLMNGRWRTPERDFLASYESLVRVHGPDEGAARVLWLGQADVLPADGWRYDDDYAFATTELENPTVLDRFVTAEFGASHLLADSVRTAETGRTNRLGHLLGPMGVRFVIVASDLSPQMHDPSRPAPDRLVDALRQQLDLAEVPLSRGITVFENTAWAPARSVLPADVPVGGDYTDAVAIDVSDAKPALVDGDRSSGATGPTGAGDVLIASTMSPDWKLTVDGAPVSRSTAFGWANSFEVNQAGEGRLEFTTSFGHKLAAGGQVVLWIAIVVIRRRALANERRLDLTAARERKSN